MSYLTRHPESPFDLDNETLYQRWRECKLRAYPERLEALLVEVNDPRRLTDSEIGALERSCLRANMAIYVGKTGSDPDTDIPVTIGRRLGLERLDRNWLGDDSGLTSLTVAGEGVRTGFIPYTNRPIRWHTDGYYNLPEQQIHGLILHCVQSAADGGGNALLDHEIAYLLLRDENPEYIRALMQPRAMTIPPRMDGTSEEGGEARGEESGPVFSITEQGELHMRFTERKRNIEWLDEPMVKTAVARLAEILNSDSPLIFRGRLEPGMGLIGNNILHDRAGFTDSLERKRMIYRGRYYDRITATGYRRTLATA